MLHMFLHASHTRHHAAMQDEEAVHPVLGVGAYTMFQAQRRSSLRQQLLQQQPRYLSHGRCCQGWLMPFALQKQPCPRACISSSCCYSGAHRAAASATVESISQLLDPLSPPPLPLGDVARMGDKQPCPDTQRLLCSYMLRIMLRPHPECQVARAHTPLLQGH